MVFFNYALRKLNAKIVYYGPGLCGKTTNLAWIHDNFEGGDRARLEELARRPDPAGVEEMWSNVFRRPCKSNG